jgi:sugar-specific transcriptional regulator TrmB
MNEARLSDELTKLGLTGYQATCYVFLVKLGPSDPRKLAAKARIPYPSAYEELKRLADLGWVERIGKRPVIYRARNPATIFAEMLSGLKSAFASLEEMYRSTPTDQTELVYTLRGKERVLSKIVEMIRGARESILFVAPLETLKESDILRDEVREAASRGVKVRVMTEEGGLEELKSKIEIRRGNILALDLLVDEDVALIGLPDLSAAGWVESSAVASHFMQFLELLWGSSSAE